ncbi:hypothetical protein EVAR_32131_1 [Eumeta japonica]|uniref:Uncharacterized protein n=1 Tax=Eumeta variegata TaxID=151549 RepID=A0A4C1V489_EUMVA|nr:hypothetical protein EVAR_32131_1 [Eumeta japonica]
MREDSGHLQVRVNCLKERYRNSDIRGRCGLMDVVTGVNKGILRRLGHLKGAKESEVRKQTYRTIIYDGRVVLLRDKRAGEPSERRWSPPPMDTRNPRGVTSAFPSSWTGCLMGREWSAGGGSRPLLKIVFFVDPDRRLTIPLPHKNLSVRSPGGGYFLAFNKFTSKKMHPPRFSYSTSSEERLSTTARQTTNNCALGIEYWLTCLTAPTS